MGDAEFPDWFALRIAECVSRLEPGLVERGEPLSAEDDAAGSVEAGKLIECREVPDCPKRCAQLFPRMWAAKGLIDRSILRPKLRIWEELDRREVLEILLQATWPDRGRQKWENPRPDGFRWG